jgi:hypothetical protein
MQGGRTRDFFVQWCENQSELTWKCLDYAFIERIRCKKNTVLVLTGDPGEAKSSIGQKTTEELLRLAGVNYKDYVNKCTVYTPLEYPDKLKHLVFDEEMKDIVIFIIDEARLVVKAKHWQSFINQAIADILALVRRKKRIFLIVITQDLEDIDKDIRRQVTFWGECYRPLHHSAELKLWRFWKDTHDPGNIRFRKRKFRGVIEKDGKRYIREPEKIEFSMPSKEVWDIYDAENYRSKSFILEKKMNEALEAIKRDIGVISDRVVLLVDWYSKPENYNELSVHLRFAHSKHYLRKEALPILGIDKEQGKEFLRLLQPVLAKNMESVKNGVSETED